MEKLDFGLAFLRCIGKRAWDVHTKFRRSIYLYFKVFITALILSLNCQTVHATDVSLSWDASQGATGYKVYYGFASQNYPFIIDIGLWTQCTISNLDFGKTYYFNVTAYNEAGESDFAMEISYSPGLCVMDFDSDGDIDGWELADIIADPSAADLSHFAIGFGRPSCDDSTGD